MARTVPVNNAVLEEVRGFEGCPGAGFVIGCPVSSGRVGEGDRGSRPEWSRAAEP
jgi:hypothetical protein